MILLLSRWGLLNVNYNSAKFGGSRSYGKEDVIFPTLIPIPISMFADNQLKKSSSKCSK